MDLLLLYLFENLGKWEGGGGGGGEENSFRGISQGLPPYELLPTSTLVICYNIWYKIFIKTCTSH